MVCFSSTFCSVSFFSSTSPDSLSVAFFSVGYRSIVYYLSNCCDSLIEASLISFMLVGSYTSFGVLYSSGVSAFRSSNGLAKSLSSIYNLGSSIGGMNVGWLLVWDIYFLEVLDFSSSLWVCTFLGSVICSSFLTNEGKIITVSSWPMVSKTSQQIL